MRGVRLLWISVGLVANISLMSVLSGCSSVFYQPTREKHFDPVNWKLEYQDIEFEASDGVRLHGWYFPAKTQGGDPAKGTVLQFHGNAENISTHFASLAWVTEAGYDFVTFDYRGYGLSDGKATQEGLNRDALAAIDYVLKRGPAPKKGVKDIVLIGQSLGGAVLLRAYQDLPDHSRIRALVIDCSFYSYKSIARKKLAQHWLTFLFQPLGWLLVSDEYSPENSIAKVSPTPLLVLHGEGDPVIPWEFGQKIYELAREPKAFWKVEKGGHINSFFVQKGKYRDLLIRFLDDPSLTRS